MLLFASIGGDEFRCNVRPCFQESAGYNPRPGTQQRPTRTVSQSVGASTGWILCHRRILQSRSLQQGTL